MPTVRLVAVLKYNVGEDLGWKAPGRVVQGHIETCRRWWFARPYFRCGLNVGDHTRMNLGLDNMGDKKYRDAHSRADSEGRNFWLSVEFKW